MPSGVRSEKSMTIAKASKATKASNDLLHPPESGLNLAIVVGVLSSEPETRVIQDRGEVASLQVRVSSPDGATLVPVTMWSPPAWLLAADSGCPVLVAGIVRRRFWRTPSGATGSRVDVEATSITRDGPRQRAALGKRAAAILASADLTPLPN